MNPSFRDRVLRVVQVNKLYPPARGGVEAHVQVLARRLSQVRGVAVTVVCAGERLKRVEEMDGRVLVMRLPSLGRFRSTPLALGLARELTRQQADILHFHFPYPPAALAYLRARTPARVVVTWHSDIVRQRFLRRLADPAISRFLSRCDRIAVTSPRLLRLSPQLARYREKCVSIPLGIETPPRSPAGKFVVAGRRGGFISREPLVLCVGRFVPYKGHEVLLRALGQLRDSKISWRAMLAGDGPLLPAMRDLAVRLGIKDRVQFPGDISDAELDRLYRSCRMLVLPSVERSEAFGLVQLEAFARGTPCVSTDLPTGVPFVNQDGRTGLVVPAGDAGALAQAIQRLLADSALARRMGDAGLRRFQAEFTAERMAGQVLALYRQVLREKPRADAARS